MSLGLLTRMIIPAFLIVTDVGFLMKKKKLMRIYPLCKDSNMAEVIPLFGGKNNSSAGANIPSSVDSGQVVSNHAMSTLDACVPLWSQLSEEARAFFHPFLRSAGRIRESLLNEQRIIIKTWTDQQVIDWVNNAWNRSFALSKPALWTVLYERVTGKI